MVKVEERTELVEPRLVLPKARVAGKKSTRGTVATVPLPVRLILCGLPEALSVTVIDPVRVPAAMGVNVRSIVQLAPGFTTPPLYGQELPVVARAKSPLDPMLAIESGAAPVLVRVEERTVLVVPTSTLPKARLDGTRLTIEAVPVPVRLMLCGLPGALSVIVTVPPRLPVVVGAKVTLILQVVPIATVEPQVVVSA